MGARHMSVGDDKSANDVRERLRLRAADIRKHALCKKRYGRASLTIRRWGRLDEFFGNTVLAKRISGFRVGNTTAEDVAWAFVRGRVESHSATFTWEDAELDRLIKLVADCSESPHLKATTADALAQELAKAQDEANDRLKSLSEQFSFAFGNARSLAQMSGMPQFTRWAELNRQTFAALSRSFVPDLTKLGGFATLADQMHSLGLAGDARQRMFPVLQPEIFTLTSTFADARIRLPDATFSELAKTLQQSFGPYSTQTASPALRAFSRHQTFTIDEAMRAAGDAVKLAEERGEREDAADLRAITTEAAEVVANPSTEKLEALVADLSKRLNERLDDIQAEQRVNEDRRREDRRGDMTLNLFFVFLQIYLAYFIWQLDHMPT